MEKPFKTVFLIVVISMLFVSSTRGAVVVYTDRAAWEADASTIAPFIANVDFEFEAPRSLQTGTNFVSGTCCFMEIIITGDPGLNKIEDNPSDPLSPDGSTFYAGEVDGSAPDAGFPALNLLGFLGSTTYGFGADWVGTTSQDGLTMDVVDTTIVFSDYLQTGSGFLGVLSSSLRIQINPVILGTEVAGGEQLFGMDNVTYVHTTPIPAAVWLFGSGLLGLVGMARRRKRS